MQSYSFEVLFDVIPTPAGIAHSFPAVVDRRTASSVRQSIDGAGASQTVAAALADCATIQTRDRERGEVPIQWGVLQSSATMIKQRLKRTRY